MSCLGGRGKEVWLQKKPTLKKKDLRTRSFFVFLRGLLVIRCEKFLGKVSFAPGFQ